MAHHHHEHVHRHAPRNFWEDLASHVKSGIDNAETALGLPGVFKQQHGSTQVITVYETAPPSGTGSIIGYKTGGGPPSTTTPAPEAHPTPSPTTKAPPLVADTTTSKKETTTTSKPKETTSGLPSSIPPPSTTPLDINNLVAATNSPTHSTSSAPTHSPTPTVVAKASGMSVGGEVGLAVGVLCLVGTIAGLLFFCFKKRRAAKREQLDDEKAEPWGGPERQVSSRANAPRLSLGPILPKVGERRQSRNAMAMTPATHRPNSWEAPVGAQDGNRHNPFGAHAETIDAANARGPPAVEVVNPEGAVVAAAGAGLTRGASKRENGSKPMDFTTKGALLPPISPVGTEFSMSSEANGAPAPTAAGAAIAAAGGPANSAVHRVQLDFKPSMDDELELRAGQLIRLLHEYDDGWVSSLRSVRDQANLSRPSVSASTALARVSCRGPACPSAPSSPALSRTDPAAPRRECAAPMASPVPCLLPWLRAGCLLL
jgi:hypothetical protein